MNLESFHADGFLRVDNMFSQEEIKKIVASFDEAALTDVDGVGVIFESDGSTVRSIMGWQRIPGVLHDFAVDERIVSVAKEILGDRIEFHQTKYNPKAPSSLGKKWDPHRGDTFWSYKDGIPKPKQMLSVFIALTEQTEENGAVYVWKGSHTVTLEEILPHMTGLDESEVSNDTSSDLSQQIKPERLEQFDRENERVLLEGPAGTVWFLDEALLHASPNNSSDEVRILVANVFRSMDNAPTHPREQEYLSEPKNGPL